MFTTNLGRIAVAGILLMAGCQSAEDRQGAVAAELRESLRNQALLIEALTGKVISEYESCLQERIASGREADVTRVRRELDRVQADLPAELDDLRQKIENSPDRELPALCLLVTLALQSRESDLTEVDWKRYRDRNLERFHQDIEGLKLENWQLLDEIESLKTDPATIEKNAREELGLRRRGTEDGLLDEDD